MDQYIGTIQLFPINKAPDGWMLCDGTSIPVMQYQPLYALIGNKFGGDARNFNIPNLIGAEPDSNLRFYIAVMGLFPVRQY